MKCHVYVLFHAQVLCLYQCSTFDILAYTLWQPQTGQAIFWQFAEFEFNHCYMWHHSLVPSPTWFLKTNQKYKSSHFLMPVHMAGYLDKRTYHSICCQLHLILKIQMTLQNRHEQSNEEQSVRQKYVMHLSTKTVNQNSLYYNNTACSVYHII